MSAFKPLPEISVVIFDELVALWKEAGPDVRQDFKAYIRGDEFVAKANPSGPGANITMRHENIQTSPSAVASAEPEASPSPPPASGNLPDPHEPISSPATAGILGYSLDGNPYSPDSAAGQAWIAAWYGGEDERKLILAMEPKPGSELIEGGAREADEGPFEDGAGGSSLAAAE